MSLRENLRLDAALSLGFVVVFFTGRPGADRSHDLLAILWALTAAWHLLGHRGWVVAMTRRLPLGLRGSNLRNYALDLLILGLTLVTVFTGLAISLWWTPSPDRDLVHLHHVAPKLLLLATGVHVALHWGVLKAACRPRRVSGAGGVRS